MTTSIVGKLDTSTQRIGFYSQPVSRKAEQDDIVLSNGRYHRMIPNHNGQRLTSCDITSYVVKAWHKSEAAADYLAALVEAERLAPLVHQTLVDPLAGVRRQNLQREAVR